MTPQTSAASPAVAPARWTVLVLCFLTILLDGFDTTSIGFVVPTLVKAWGLPPQAFTPAFVMTSLGAVVGYLASGHLSQRWGRRGAVLASVALFALGTLFTALVSTVAELAVLRLITGAGLGAALPACLSLSVEGFDPRRREVVTVAVAAGLGVGVTIAGLSGGALVGHYGWPSVFVVGGVVPLLLLPVLWWQLPADAAPAEGAVRGATGRADDAAVRHLFEGPLRWKTVLLWSFSFLVFTAMYALTFWVPTLLASFGFSPEKAPLGSAAIGAGGFVAGLVLVPLTAWFGARRVLGVAMCGGVALIVTLSRAELAPGVVLFTLGALGGCLISGTLGQSVLAVAMYPAASRTAGVGWSAALGRIGSIVGPAVGGALISIGQSPREVLFTLCLPIAAAALVAFAMKPPAAAAG